MAGGKRGPQKTPTAELIKRGSWRAKTDDRKHEIEIATPAQIPAAPAWLGGKAHDIWTELAAHLHKSGLLTEIDTHTLGMFASRLNEYLELAEEVKRLERGECKLDILTKDLIKARDTASTDTLRYAREFGLSPASRAGLVINPTGKPKGEILDMFAKG